MPDHATDACVQARNPDTANAERATGTRLPDYWTDVERAKSHLLNLYAAWEGQEPFQSWWNSHPELSKALDTLWDAAKDGRE